MTSRMQNFSSQYQNALLDNVLPFWTNHSIDEKFGGFFTCLSRNGQVYDTDKFIWLQARQVWTFAMLYQRYQAHDEWLTIALHGARFLEQHGRNEHGDWYFSLTRQGQPLIQPYNIFSDCFATMAFGQLYQVTGEESYATIATATFQNILRRQDNPKGRFNKIVPGTRPLKNFALPMILCNLALEIEPLLDKSVVAQTIADCLHQVMQTFYRPELGLILENVSPHGDFIDSFEGRLLNPGHAIEAMWFVMDLAIRQKDDTLLHLAVDITLQTLEYGWDQAYGGIFYFLDCKGHPPQQLEWDQKLWWVHLEALVALARGYALTARPACREWFIRLHDYTWDHFPDPKYGEWYGYLNRQGQPHLSLKGGKWKGCFHLPRGLWQCWQALESIPAKDVGRSE